MIQYQPNQQPRSTPPDKRVIRRKGRLTGVHHGALSVANWNGCLDPTFTDRISESANRHLTSASFRKSNYAGANSPVFPSRRKCASSFNSRKWQLLCFTRAACVCASGIRSQDE
jgi:hypothetical protein